MLKQTLSQKMLQKLSPQQIQLMKLLQVPTAMLEQRIKEEIEQNPALEEGAEEEDEEKLELSEDDKDSPETEDDFDTEPDEVDIDAERANDDIDIEDYLQDEDLPYYKTQSKNYSADDQAVEMPVTFNPSFMDHLHSQLGICNLDDRQILIADQILGSLDDDGYLRRDLNAIVNDLAFSQNVSCTLAEVEQLLKLVQSFDPAGVGARDLRECLLLQLDRRKELNTAAKHALAIVSDYMEEFSRKHYDKIASKLNLSEAELKNAVQEILKLNPKPGNAFGESNRPTQHIIPDFIIVNRDGMLDLTLNSRNAPELRVSPDYREMLRGYSEDKSKDKSSKEAVQFIKQKLDAAKWFIDAIKQRQLTLLTTMDTIMNYQYDYFLDGDETKLKPMILKDIAEIVGLDISTVSRVANSKYVQTPHGTFLLKSFFSESLSTDSGEEVSTREVKKILTEAVENENKRKPLPDEKLAKILNEKGYNIARRTIAKYREQLGIPVARLRKQL
ncbi:MAG TPA: RNA polymerase factor sigma-54 [Bacteroidia bacterium]|nr:RNA polymerase factor sigma-54 [Bacteroidia bacterium]HNT79118.1 RNA polymerase factor sigma-54 [Bacteroidia bacterium]